MPHLSSPVDDFHAPSLYREIWPLFGAVSRTFGDSFECVRMSHSKVLPARRAYV
ncbi:hypothetical protein BDZ89DRAFT_1061436 [Hymenopellis radicata]|nr:hypothetical protein BDZ89DRAFT_1061436 [Hymenopellis radicata]